MDTCHFAILSSYHVDKLENEINKENILVDRYVSSAHKNTRNVLELIDRYNMDKRNIIWVTVAGRSNALSGVVAANSQYPVIACPPFSNKTDMIEQSKALSGNHGRMYTLFPKIHHIYMYIYIYILKKK